MQRSLKKKSLALSHIHAQIKKQSTFVCSHFLKLLVLFLKVGNTVCEFVNLVETFLKILHFQTLISAVGIILKLPHEQ